MKIHSPWDDRLEEPLAREHLVQLYRDDRLLVEAVALFAGRGLAKGEAVILVATPAHLAAVEERLKDRGFDVEGPRQWGQLRVMDAETLLARFMVEGRPDPARFGSILSETISAARAAGRYRKVRVYGEMVNLLWKENHAAARMLEELWNGAIQAHSVSLLCGYGLDADAEAEERFPHDLRELHSHLIPVIAGG